MTNKSTWDGDSIIELYRMLKKGIKKERFMFRLFWGVLEHDLYTSKLKAKESERFYATLKKSITKFGKAYEQVVNDLIAATKNSDKF